MLNQNPLLKPTGKLGVHALHQRGFFAWKTRLLNTESSLVQVKYCKAAFANIHFNSAKLFGPTMFILAVCYSWIFAHMFWGSLLFLLISNLQANQGMCQMSASHPDYFIFPRVKTKQNFLVFQEENQDFVTSFTMHYKWIKLLSNKSQFPGKGNNWDQFISAAPPHPPDPFQSRGLVAYVSESIDCCGVGFCV